MVVLGLSCFYHDSAASIIKDGEVIAGAAEERFSRVKHDNGFPKQAIEFCLDYSGIAMNEVDVVAFYEKPIIKFERILSQHLDNFPKSHRTFIDTIGQWFGKRLQIKKLLKEECYYHGKIVYIPHHLSHAASSYYLSDFKESAIVTIDGVGEWATTTVGVGEENKIRIDEEIHFPHSLGLLYSTITTYLGFKANNDEYKVMGLAGYGKADRFKEQMDKLISFNKDGSYQLEMEYFDYVWAKRMSSKSLEELFGYPVRKIGGKIYQYHRDVAAALQAKLEEVVFNLLKAVSNRYQTRNLCMAGGVCLNSVMNGKIVKNTSFRNIFIPPDPGDGGGAIGAALYVYFQKFKGSNKSLANGKSFSVYLGPEYSKKKIEMVLKRYHLEYRYYQDREKLLEKVSNLLIKQKVVGWYQGRMEWGPRALGNRSILASASEEKMKDVINAKVKKREMFRPFAPVILKEAVSRYFETENQPLNLGKYMLMVLPFKEKGKKEVPATVHVNGSGRLQIIDRKDNPLYYDLIKKYGQKTGTPVVINTSFNVRGEPIVCTPEEAVRCFLNTGIDILVIDNYIVIKKGD